MKPQAYYCIDEVNAKGVACAAYLNTGETFFFQYANETAVNSILSNPLSVYDWQCVKNGIKK